MKNFNVENYRNLKEKLRRNTNMTYPFIGVGVYFPSKRGTHGRPNIPLVDGVRPCEECEDARYNTICPKQNDCVPYTYWTLVKLSHSEEEFKTFLNAVKRTDDRVGDGGDGGEGGES